jgi:hypothetical protein
VDAALAYLLFGEALVRAGSEDDARTAFASARRLAVRAGHRVLEARVTTASSGRSSRDDPR